MKPRTKSELRRSRVVDPARAQAQWNALDRTIRRVDAQNRTAPGARARPEEVGLTVVGRTEWTIHHAQGFDNQVGGVHGQLTAVDVCGVRAFVRENVERTKPTFLVSSGERLRQKQEGRIAGEDVLEVAAPADALACVVDAVARVDHLQRRVRTHPQFTLAWAENKLRSAGVELPPPRRPGRPVQGRLF